MKKRILAGILSAMIAAGTLPAISVSAKIDLNDLPTPISSKEVASFEKSKPKIKKNNESYYYYAHLEWSEVDGALYYEVYRRSPEGGSYAKVYETLDNYFVLRDYGQYIVRAVTFTYDDKKKYSDYSNTVEYKSEEYDDDDISLGAPVEDEADYEDDDVIASAAPVEDDQYDLPAEAEYEPSDEEFVTTGSPVDDADYDYDVPNTEEYSHSEESGYKNPAITPLSTFSADVDTASYANIRRLINDEDKVPADAVRIEEMLNYFDYSYPKPEKTTFNINTELTDCPWNSGSQLLKVGIQGKDLAETPASNLVFLVDTSGSMDMREKIDLVIKSIKTLSKTMTDKDRISIVTYSGEERIILAGAKGTQIKTVSAITSLLYADGSTNGESGINAAYAIAEKYFIKDGNNRIILMTDGDLNVGISSEEELTKLIEEKRKSGVYFTVLGFGKDNIKDNKMEALADNGNGSYHYIDTAREAYKVLSDERNSTLFTIAGDVKIQVEFNPANVKSYRLIGYDNRRMANEDFYNNAKDAGEVGAGQSVTALYEIVPANGAGKESLKYQETSGNAATSELLTIKVRCKNAESGKVQQYTKTVSKEDYSKTMSDGMKLACAVSEFGLTLKDSSYKGNATAQSALKLAQSIDDPDVYTKELISLIKKYIKNTK
ncbi:MAG: von Willebrand factor type A domain-containing protein [Oscillospiraceae bacterium]|nr:von Willebrand factor type A domain-containing protein [Oscillospiraceae bacterium]